MSEQSDALSDVLRILPAECYENPTARGVRFLLRDFALYLGVLCALAATDAWYLVLPLWLLAGLTISALFVLGHDAAHGALFASRKLNYRLGQAAMLPAFHLYEAWVFGHNRIHHGHTIRGSMDYVWHPLTPEEYAALSPLRRALHRLEWSWLGGGIYYLVEIWWKQMVRFQGNDKIRPAIRRDRRIVGAYAALVCAAALAFGFASYGSLAGAAWSLAKLVAVPFLIFNYSIGTTVYVHHIAPDIAWHPRKGWTKFMGQMEGTTILHVPAWLNFFYHNIFLHVPHHVDMRIPFYGLPRAVEALRKHYGHVVRERTYTLRDYIRTTRACKLFDFERRVWLGYGAQEHPFSGV